MGKNSKLPKKHDNLGALIPSLSAFGERVAAGHATSDEIKFMTKVADLAVFQGSEHYRRALINLRGTLGGI